MPSTSPIPCQRELFELPRDLAYFNAAYMTPLPRAAVRAGELGVRRKAQPWQLRPVDFFTESEEARTLFARLIGATADGVAIVPSTSYGLAVASRNLPLRAGQRVVTVADQFPSNVYCWRRSAQRAGAQVIAVEAGPDGDLGAAVLAAIDERCAVAALPQCRWTDGRLIDLEAVGRRCREVGAALVLDLTQSLGALPFDLAAVQPDFVACGGYKWLLGPYSLSWLYVAADRRDGEPLEETWLARAGSEDFARLVDYVDAYQPGARRFDVGERSNFVLMPMALESLRLLLDWGVTRIQASLVALTDHVCREVHELGIGTVPAQQRAGHYLGLGLPPGTPGDLTSRLAGRGVHVSVRGDRVRVTPHLYNDAQDIERLVGALRAELAGR